MIGCSKNEDDQSQVDCVKLKAALLNFNSEQLNFEVNKLTLDLLPIPSENDELGHINNLNTLIDRLNSNCPQIRASKLCYACIDTFPLLSESRLEFIFLGDQFDRIIDVSTPSDGILLSRRSHIPRSP